jgi:hypothetical protein
MEAIKGRFLKNKYYTFDIYFNFAIMSVLDSLNKRLGPWYSLLSMLIFFGVLFIGASKYIFKSSDLNVVIKTEKASYPQTVNEYYDKIHEFLLKKDSLLMESTAIYNFLNQTTDVKEIVLKNTSSNTLREVKFRHLNADALTAWALGSNYLSSSEEISFRDNLIFDENRGLIYIKNTIDIPPNGEVYIDLYGNFKPSFINNDVIVNYAGGDAQIQESYEVTGLKGYFVEYYFEFIVILIIIFVAVYYNGIKYVKEE